MLAVVVLKLSWPFTYEISKYFQTEASCKVSQCLEGVFLRTWELVFPV